MSSTTNVQDLLVNVFRPSYRYTAEGGFVPSLSLSNLSEVNTKVLKAQVFSISDSNKNTFVGSNAGVAASNAFSNTGVGYQALGNISNGTNNVAVGIFALNVLSNSSNNTALGSSNLILGTGQSNVLIGRNITMGAGTGNILIGTDISVGTITKKFQLGTLLYGDLSSGFIGVNLPEPEAAFDISGEVYFRNKVGFQKANPDYSLDVLGSVYASEQFIGGSGTQAAPLFTFKTTPGTGMYVPDVSAGYGTGSFGIATLGQRSAIFASNKVYFFRDLDVDGTFSARAVNIDAFKVVDGSAGLPSMTFTSDSSTGFYLGAPNRLGFTTGGFRRMEILSNGDVSMGRLAVKDISYSGAIIGSDTTSCNVIGGVTLSNGNVIISGVATNSNMLVPGWLRDTQTTPTLDISGGNISNSGLHIAGGVIAPYVRNTRTGWTYDISGGNISNSGVHTTTGLVGTYLRSAASGWTYDISGGTISNSALTRSSNFRGSDGSVSVPTYSFASDPSTGVHLVGPSTLAFDTGGIQRMCISGGNVGIGVTRPVVALEVAGDVSAVTYNGPGGTAGAPHYTFSDDRTTGIFFPGANIVGLTAGGLERMRIAGSNIGINTTNPSNALDVSGTLRIIGTAGNIIFSNGVIEVSGTQIYNPSGAFINAVTTSNRIGGVTLSNFDLCMAGTGRLLAPILRNALTPSQFDISGGNISNSGVVTTSGVVGTYLRSAATGWTYDISGGNISNSGVHTTAGLVGTYLRSAATGWTYDISGGNISNSGVVSTAGLVGTYLRNALSPTTYDISGGNISNSLVTQSRNFLGAPGGAPRPAYAFTTDPSSGIDLSGTNVLAFETGGLHRMFLSNSSLGVGRFPVADASLIFQTPSNAYISTGRVYLGDAPNSTPAFGSTFIEGLSNNAGGGGACDLLFYSRTGGAGVGTDPRERMRIVGQTGWVGIGTTTPLCALHVDTSTAVADELVSVLASSTQDSNHRLVAARGNASAGTFGEVTTQFGLVYRHNAINYYNTMIRFHRGGGFTEGYMSFTTNTNNERMRLDHTGKLGIGTTAPTHTLDVSGNLRVFNDSTDVMGLFSPTYGNYMAIGGWNRAGNTSCNVVINQYGGFLGIGHNRPRYMVDISSGVGDQGISITAPNGQLNIRDPRVSFPLQMYQNPTTQGLYSVNTLPVYLYQNGGVKLSLNTLGVGMGTLDPSFALDVIGSARISGGLIFSVQSI